MAELGHVAVQIDYAVMIVEQVSHEAVNIVRDDLLLLAIGSQVVVHRVAIQHSVEIIDADVAVKTIIGEPALALMPHLRIAAPALEKLHRSMSFDEAAGQQPWLASDFLQAPKTH